MLDDSASHRVFKIGELAGAIASQLIPISQKSAVNLACTCRYLEEPVLSALWEEQVLSEALLGILPEGGLNQKFRMSKGGWEVSGRDVSLEHRTLTSRRFSTRS